MIITAEMWVGIIGIVAAIVAGMSYVAKRQADARALKAEGDKETAEGEAAELKAKADAIRNDSIIRLKEVESKVAQDTVLSTMLQQLQTERLDWLKQLQTKEAADAANYRMLANTQRDNTQMLLTEIQNKSRLQLAAIDAIPAKIQASNAQSLTDFAKMLGSELALVIAQEFSRQKLDASLYPFPDSDDALWREEMVYPTTPEVTIRKEPRFSDDSMLLKPCAKITHGERVRVLTGLMPKWIAVDKIEAGVRCYGWLPDYAIRIGQPETAAAPA